MEVDIIDMVDFVPLHRIKENRKPFDFFFEKFEHGWLYITITALYKRLSCQAPAIRSVQ
jgi:hypothetical protein